MVLLYLARVQNKVSEDGFGSVGKPPIRKLGCIGHTARVASTNTFPFFGAICLALHPFAAILDTSILSDSFWPIEYHPVVQQGFKKVKPKLCHTSGDSKEDLFSRPQGEESSWSQVV